MNKVRQFRLNKGLTQEELAEQTSLSASYLSDIESDNVIPSLTALKRISSALKAPIASLLDREEDNKKIKVNFDHFNHFCSNYKTGSNSYCPFAGKVGQDNPSTDPATLMIIVSLYKMSAENRRKLLRDAVALVYDSEGENQSAFA